MNFLPEVGLGQRHNLLDSGDDTDYDSDPGSGLKSTFRIRITIRITSRAHGFSYNFYQRCVSAH